MVIECPKCKKQYNVDGSRVTEQGVKITCPACQHQFIVRRKQDEPQKAETKKPEPKKPKTPPCAICGEPSTHVLKGPPPRPMCEYHYRVEKEKESRFFDSIPDVAPTQATPPAADPGATRIAFASSPAPTPAPSAAQSQAQPPPATTPAKPGTSRPGTSKPGDSAFESFDDDFDFTEPEVAPVPSAPAKAAPPMPEDEDEEIPLADPHEFLDRLNAGGHEPKPSETMDPVPVAKPEPPPQPEAPPKPDQTMAPAVPSAPAPAPAKPAPADAAFDFDEPAAKPASPPPTVASDPFRPEPRDISSPGTAPARPAAPMPSMERAAPEAKPAAAATQRGLDADSFRHAVPTNLDGSPAEEHFPESEEQEVSYEWNRSAGGGKSRTTSLDEELAKSLQLEGEDVRPAMARPTAEQQLQAYRPAKPKNMASAVSVLVILLLAAAASGFFALSGHNGVSGTSGQEAALTPPQWHGQLGEVEEQSEPQVPVDLPTLAPGPGMDRVTRAVAAQDQVQAVLKLMYRDTRASYGQALKSIDEDLRVSPENPSLLAAKIDILAFRESRDDKGKSVLRSDDSKQAFSALDSSIQDSPAMIRAKAHVLLNDRKTVAAQALLKGWLEKNPRDAVAMYLMGLTYRYQPKPDLNEAARNLENAVKIEPGFVAAYWDLAEIYRQLGRYDDAVDMYNQVLNRSPDRTGTAEAMEDTMRQKAQGAPHRPQETASQPLITIPVQTPPEPTGIEVTGPQISKNILEVINLVEPNIRRLDLTPLTQPAGPQPRALPRPPEEAP